MIHIMIAAHTITSPNSTINIALPVLMKNTANSTNKINVNNRIINKIIITHLLSIIENV